MAPHTWKRIGYCSTSCVRAVILLDFIKCVGQTMLAPGDTDIPCRARFTTLMMFRPMVILLAALYKQVSDANQDYILYVESNHYLVAEL